MRDTSISKKEDKKERKKERAHPIPADFKPDLEWAIARKQWSAEEAAQEAERFTNHYTANGKAWVDWQAVWRKWVTSPYQMKGTVNGNGHAPPRPHSREARIERTNAAFDRLIDASQGNWLDPKTPLRLPKP